MFQTVADVLKLLIKEDVIPAKADAGLFKLAPAIAFVPAFAVMAVIPFTPSIQFSDFAVGLLYYMAVSSITIIGILVGGWASNNKYALIGGMRSAAQMISYEIPLVMSVVGIALSVGSLNLAEIGRPKRGLVYFSAIYRFCGLFDRVGFGIEPDAV